MALATFNFEGATVGNNLTTANTGASVVSAVGGSAVASGTAAHGNVSGSFTGTTSNGALARFTAATASTTMAGRFYFRLAALPSAGGWVGVLRHSASNSLRINVTAAGLIQVYDESSTPTSTGVTISLNAWYRVEIRVVVGATTTTGQWTVNVYNGDSLTAINANPITSSTANLGTTAITAMDVGQINLTSSFTVLIDDVALNDGSTSEIGPPGVDATVSAVRVAAAAAVAAPAVSVGSIISAAVVAAPAIITPPTSVGSGTVFAALFGANDANTTSGVSGGFSSAVTLAKPSNLRDGDLLIAHVCMHIGLGTWNTPPAGWVKVFEFNTDRSNTIWYKQISSAGLEPANYSWNNYTGGDSRFAADLFRITGAVTSNPIDAVGTAATQQSGGLSTIANSISPVGTSDMLLSFTWGFSGSVTPAAITADPQLTEGIQVNSPTTQNVVTVQTAYQELTGPGATGTRTQTFSHSVASGGTVLLAVTPLVASQNARPAPATVNGVTTMTRPSVIAAPSLVTVPAPAQIPLMTGTVDAAIGPAMAPIPAVIYAPTVTANGRASAAPTTVLASTAVPTAHVIANDATTFESSVPAVVIIAAPSVTTGSGVLITPPVVHGGTSVNSFLSTAVGPGRVCGSF